MREVFILKSGNACLYRTGTSTGVLNNTEFFEFRNFMRNNPGKVIFFHSHPPGCEYASGTDIATWRGLRQGLGFNFDCAIVLPKKVIWFWVVKWNGYPKIIQYGFLTSFILNRTHAKLIRKIRHESGY